MESKSGCHVAPARLTIDVQRADVEVVRAANEFISAMAKGDADTVRALLRQNVVSHPQLQPVLERMGPAPPLDRVIYRTADQLDPPDRENPIDNPPY